MRRLFRRPIATVIGVLGLVIVAVVGSQVLSSGPDPLPKFISYFDRPGVVYIQYSASESETEEEWIDYRNEKRKELTQRKGKTTYLVLSTSKEVKTFSKGGRVIDIERANLGNRSLIIEAVNAAKKGELEEIERQGGSVFYSFKKKQYKSSFDTPWYVDSEISVSEKTGKLAGLLVNNEDGGVEQMSYDVKSIKHLPASAAKDIFSMKEVKSAQLEGGSDVSLGLDGRKLREYKPVKAYWLGESVNGVEVSNMGATKFPDGVFVTVTYGSIDRPQFEITTERADNPQAREILETAHTFEQAKINGNEAFIQEYLGSPRVYVLRGNAFLQIDGFAYSYAERKKFIKLIEENLQKP